MKFPIISIVLNVNCIFTAVPTCYIYVLYLCTCICTLFLWDFRYDNCHLIVNRGYLMFVFTEQSTISYHLQFIKHCGKLNKQLTSLNNYLAYILFFNYNIYI